MVLGSYQVTLELYACVVLLKCNITRSSLAIFGAAECCSKYESRYLVLNLRVNMRLEDHRSATHRYAFDAGQHDHRLAMSNREQAASHPLFILNDFQFDDSDHAMYL